MVQRGNRSQAIFVEPGDRDLYMAQLAERCRSEGVEIWAYCLMENHIHLIAVPERADALSRAIGQAHRRYALRINKREGWSGHHWQQRFFSAPLDEAYLIAATRYVEGNPVRARLAADPAAYPWSSARAHLDGRDDGLVRVAPLLERIPDWRTLLLTGMNEAELSHLRRHLQHGWPLGDERFLEALCNRFAVAVRSKKPGLAKNSKN